MEAVKGDETGVRQLLNGFSYISVSHFHVVHYYTNILCKGYSPEQLLQVKRTMP